MIFFHLFLNVSLTTEPIPISGEVCVSFYYMMYGNNLGSLEIYTEKDGSSKPALLLKENKGKRWYQAQVTINLRSTGDKVQYFFFLNHWFKMVDFAKRRPQNGLYWCSFSSPLIKWKCFRGARPKIPHCQASYLRQSYLHRFSGFFKF